MTRRSIAAAAVLLLAVCGLCDRVAVIAPTLASAASAAGQLSVSVAYAAEPQALSPPSASLPGTTADTATLRRGADLAAIGDCVVCHTASHGMPFAGGRPLDTPFGTIFSTNITPDRDTGIGAWPLDAFVRAMRQGVSRDGHRLYPAFPYPHFTHMTDADIAAVYAFLMSREPVHATPPANRLMFPLGFRPLIAGWNLLFLHQGVEPDGTAAAGSASPGTPAVELARGRYLVDGPGHCAACHTPLNLLGAEKHGREFEGAVIEGWQAPPLTTLMQAQKPWTRDQLIAYLRTGFANDHGAAAGPMRPVTQSLADASEQDVGAMADYLLSLQSGSSSPTPAAPATPTAQTDTVQLQSGAALFNGACAQCHSPHAPMTSLGGRPSLALDTALSADSPRNTVRAILDGIPAHAGSSGPSMPAFGTLFTDAQIADLATFLRSRFSHQPAWSIDEAAVAKLRKEPSEP